LEVTHQGNYLEVKGKAETIVTLTCHRCLKQYNYRLKLKSSELIWLEEVKQTDSASVEIEVVLEDLVETLPPNGHFHPGKWIYDQLCLELPHKQICDPKCVGIILNDDVHTENSETISDSRWASLKSLKHL
jgi:uncharacterized protein